MANKTTRMGVLKIYIGCFIMFLTISSCKTPSSSNDQNLLFIHLDSVPGNYLIDKIIIDDDSLKEEISNFILREIKEIIKNNNVKDYYYEDKFYFSRDFYIKNKNTSYFINNGEDPGGWSSYELTNHKKDRIAVFYAKTNEKHSNTIIGNLIFYGKNHNLYQTDTININIKK